MDQILTEAFIIGLIAATLRIAAPLALAAMGELFSERSGVLNLRLEGMMLMGAFAGFWATWIMVKNLPWSSSSLVLCRWIISCPDGFSDRGSESFFMDWEVLCVFYWSRYVRSLSPLAYDVRQHKII